MRVRSQTDATRKREEFHGRTVVAGNALFGVSAWPWDGGFVLGLNGPF